MQRAAALVGATSDRRVDLGLEGDDFYVQFADALIEPASETSSDHDELDAAWRGSWPRPVGPQRGELAGRGHVAELGR